jgi:hypothetical protein
MRGCHSLRGALPNSKEINLDSDDSGLDSQSAAFRSVPLLSARAALPARLVNAPRFAESWGVSAGNALKGFFCN